MHVDENDFDMFGNFRQFRIGDAKRIVGRRHEHAALQIQNRRFFSRSCFQDGQAASRIVRADNWPAAGSADSWKGTA